MTATDKTATPETEDPRIFVWLAKPQVGREQLLMVLTDSPIQGTVYRPLLFVDAESAENMRDTARQAAEELGVEAVLREFAAVAILDRTGTPR